ncbi:hypothetical protein CBS147343_7970 [Aspergillus niger]|nr:hypothetical protein CBS147343_7970 [Aspergillus niger]
MASWLRPLKSILQIVSSKDRQTAKRDKKKVIVVMPKHQLSDGENDKDKDKDEEGAGTDYHDSFPVVGASSIDDLLNIFARPPLVLSKRATSRIIGNTREVVTLGLGGIETHGAQNATGNAPSALAAETASTQPPNANRQHLVSTGCASQTFKMRTYDDSFSGQKIYPGKGKLYVRGDSKIFRFQNGKSESLFLQRKNPRRIAWTVLYRRQHKKGISEEVAKKRTRRVVKSQRAIVGASLDVIKERRAQRPEARAAARQQAIKDAKEKKAANESRKRAEKAKAAASGAKPAQRIQSKQGAKGSAPKVAAKSR